MHDLPSTIALFASSRRNGNTGQFTDAIAKVLQIEVIDVTALNIAPYDYAHANRSDDFEPLMRRLLEFDQIILASPLYWYGVAAPLKVFLDRISDYLDIPDLLEQGRRLRGKRGLVICTSVNDEAAPPFIDALQQTFEYLGMTYGGVAHANCRDGYVSAVHTAEIERFITPVAHNRPG